MAVSSDGESGGSIKETLYDSMRQLVDIRAGVIELLRNVDSVISEIRNVAEGYDGIIRIDEDNDESS
jgi:hypothetical protein